MAGLFYLPRLYVYHAERGGPDDTTETFKVMERRLLRAIMNPAMIATWTFGLMLALTPGIVDWRSDGWFHVKLAAVAAMTGSITGSACVARISPGTRTAAAAGPTAQ